MESQFELAQTAYQHIILEGTAYEAGLVQGEIHKHNPRFRGFCSAVDIDPTLYGYPRLSDFRAEIERCCPGLVEEIHGFADACGVPPEKAFHYIACSQTVSGCSHMVAHPSITYDGHLYVGRSYELNPEEEDRCLYTTRIQGKARHTGFSTLFFGRLDGINEHGLVMTMSAGITPPERDKTRGFDFWIAARAVLDQCRTAKEAVEWLSDMPLNCYQIFMFADPSGDAALVECAGTRHAVRWTSPEEPYLIANNHYSLPEMESHNLDRDLGFSTCRRQAIRENIETYRPNVSPETLKQVLMAEYPNGCFCPYYAVSVGTLWSMVFDATDKTVQLTFGAPTHNEWHTFGFDGPPGVTEYMAMMPTKK